MNSKAIGDGRIILWEGGSIWVFDVSARDIIRPNRTHSHHAYQLTIATSGARADIRTEDGLLQGRVILIGPDVNHAIEPDGKIALIFADPEGRAGTGLRRLLNGRSTACLDPPEELDGLLEQIWLLPHPGRSRLSEIGNAILRLFLDTEPETAINARIERVLAWIDENPTDLFRSSDAARIACLSESRFSHLFVAEVGLPFRTYVLWRRLMKAVEAMSSGARMTAAAHESGFADSAHFSRTFHRMFGLPPASMEVTPSAD